MWKLRSAVLVDGSTNSRWKRPRNYKQYMESDSFKVMEVKGSTLLLVEVSVEVHGSSRNLKLQRKVEAEACKNFHNWFINCHRLPSTSTSCQSLFVDAMTNRCAGCPTLLGRSLEATNNVYMEANKSVHDLHCIRSYHHFPATAVYFRGFVLTPSLIPIECYSFHLVSSSMRRVFYELLHQIPCYKFPEAEL